MNSYNTEITLEKVIDALISMSVESWRLSRISSRLASKLDAAEQKRYKSQFLWFDKKLKDALNQVGFNLVNVEGQPFDPGMAVTPLNIEEFEVDDILCVDQMLEPIIMGKNGLVKTGTVTLRRVTS